MHNEESFSARLKSWRNRLGVSQENAAETLGVGRSYYTRLETGKKKPGRFLVEKFEILEREPVLRIHKDGSDVLKAHETPPLSSSPRARLKQWRERSRLTLAELAKITRLKAGILQALEDGSARITERMARTIATALKLSDDEREYLLDNSDHSPLGHGMEGTIGARPNVESPKGLVPRFIPLISWAQAGAADSLAPEDIYDYTGQLAVAVKDPDAIAIPIQGDSMEPKFSDGDIAIVFPSRKAQTGNLVVAKLVNGTVLFKRFHVMGRGQFRLTSYNEVYPPLDVDEADVQWVYPVGLTQQKHL